MAILEILEFPDQRLRTKAAPVDAIDDSISTIIDDMLETMYNAQGVGLAATQVDIHKQIIVMDTSEDRSDPIVLINPSVVSVEGVGEREEGCLSFPGVYAKINRASTITINFTNREGQADSLSADGLLAICIQHEMDHLQGKLFVDYLSPLKRQRIRAKLEKKNK